MRSPLFQWLCIRIRHHSRAMLYDIPAPLKKQSKFYSVQIRNDLSVKYKEWRERKWR